MAATMLPPSGGTVRDVRAGPRSPVVGAEGTRTVVALEGETDVSSMPDLSDVLSGVIASGTGDVIIDLTKVTFIDTATVRAFATAQQSLDGQGRGLTFRSPPRLAIRLLDMFGLANLIEIARPVQP
jgi:anti-sigma B factor antagonist